MEKVVEMSLNKLDKWKDEETGLCPFILTACGGYNLCCDLDSIYEIMRLTPQLVKYNTPNNVDTYGAS